MAENRFLSYLRRNLADLSGAGALLEQQAGLVVRLSQAASRQGEEVADVVGPAKFI